MSNRFNELLPWYVNGTLGDADRAWVEQHLAEHPEAREELAWYRSLQARVREDVPAVPPTIGLARTLHLIRGDRPTISERVSAWFGALGMRPGLALAGLAVMALQGGVIYQMVQAVPEDRAEIRSPTRPPTVSGPVFRMSFAPQSTEADIRLLLVSVQGELVAGPGPAGEYFVRVPAGQEPISAERLKDSPFVQSVALLSGLPTHLLQR